MLHGKGLIHIIHIIVHVICKVNCSFRLPLLSLQFRPMVRWSTGVNSLLPLTVLSLGSGHCISMTHYMKKIRSAIHLKGLLFTVIFTQIRGLSVVVFYPPLLRCGAGLSKSLSSESSTHTFCTKERCKKGNLNVTKGNIYSITHITLEDWTITYFGSEDLQYRSTVATVNEGLWWNMRCGLGAVWLITGSPVWVDSGFKSWWFCVLWKLASLVLYDDFFNCLMTGQWLVPLSLNGPHPNPNHTSYAITCSPVLEPPFLPCCTDKCWNRQRQPLYHPKGSWRWPLVSSIFYSPWWCSKIEMGMTGALITQTVL